MVNTISTLCERAIAERVFPGCAVGVVTLGKQWCRSFGRHTYQSDAHPVRDDSIFDVASITKAVPVALLALLLIDRGELNYQNRLIDIVPEYSGSYRDEITLLHLLTHTLDFGFRLSAFRHLPGDELMAKILSAPLRSRPGSTFSYANATSILLGLMIERVMGLMLDAAAEKELFGPLGMRRTVFFPDRFNRNEIVPTELDPARGGVVHAEVHDESAATFRPKVVGSAGLFSTVLDLMKIIQLLLGNGSYNGKRFYSPSTIAMMGRNLCPAEGAYAGAGWELAQPVFMGNRCSQHTFGKTGFTGCSLVVNPEAQAGLVLLSNHIHPVRRPDRSAINTVRRELADVVCGQ